MLTSAKDNKHIKVAIDQSESMLTVQEFIDVANFDISSMYVDRFFNALDQKHWIYVDEKLLKWLGYKNIRQDKSEYIKILRLNFTENKHFKVIADKKLKEIKKNSVPGFYDLEKDIEIVYHNRKNHIIVHPLYFKMSCMMINTKKAKQIRFYFVKLEELFKLYVAYQHEMTTKELVAKNKRLEFKCHIRDQMRKYQKDRLEKTGYVYIQSSKKYTLEGLFKVGRGKDSMARNSAANTFRIQEDEIKLLYEIKSYDYKNLERVMHKILESRNHNKEWFHFPYKKIVEIIEIVNEGVGRGAEIFNSFITDLPDEMSESEWYEGVDMSKFDRSIVSITTAGKTHILNIDAMSDDDKISIRDIINKYVQEKNDLPKTFDIANIEDNEFTYNVSWNEIKAIIKMRFNQPLSLLRKAVKKVINDTDVVLKR